MTSSRLSYLGFASVLALGANGCASVPPPARMVEVRPARTAAEPPGSAAGNLYQAAVAAIDRRDYARALDLLQAARDHAPQDARVLNAFGVVYDKLGRFDLSGRYYAQAEAADPHSSIVAENQAYSNVLQGKAPLPVLAAQEAAPPTAPPSAPAPAPAPTASLATARPSSPAPGAGISPPTTRVASAQILKVAAPPPAAVQAPLVIASTQASPDRRLPSLVTAPFPEHAATAVPVTRVALASESRAPLPAAPAPLQRSTVGLVVAPSSPAPRPAVTPLQVASIPPQPSLKVQPPSLQARVQLAALPVAPAPTPPIPAMSQPAVATKPLIVLQSQVERRSPLPPITQVAVRANAPAMVVAPPPARAPVRLTALPVLQSMPPAVLRRVNLPVFQVASSLTPQAYGLTSRPPADRPAPTPAATREAPPAGVPAAQAAAPPAAAAATVVHAWPSGRTAPVPRPLGAAVAPRQAAASVPVRPASLTRAVATIAAPPAPRRPTGAGFIGRALVIIDASGNRRMADALRLQLARRGWSVPGARLPSVAKRGQTTIRYAAAHASVARALANSLRTPVKLERCARPCRGVSLILGADSRAPTGNLRPTSGLRRLS
ncbi:LytR C-terminal domain-containing protein [Phenylobacterium sp.]|uniref:LytR C-terminal domain-containing protein n=1 Tax=Phenylobacterium sp. TaxID=1871053 RepID=UPI002E328BCC|nr:LytR C-terminal domain-containing protein [Phenylobacterium sp.]HEX4711040.1 LytR C-terminal domain-containing protein [Phenylobacterium sp.]